MNSRLAQKILCSILAASVLGITANFNAAEAADKEITTKALTADKIAADANDTITFINDADTKVRGVVVTDDSGKRTISGYATLNVFNQKANGVEGIADYRGDGLVSYGSNLIVKDIGTVNLGTVDKPLVYFYGGQAIHALNHSVKLVNIGELNIYTNSTGIMAQMTGVEGSDDPSVSIQATGNVNIDAKSIGILIGAINDNPGITGVEINAGGKVTIKAGASAVQSYDKDQLEYKGTGKANTVISGDKGVDISSTSNSEYAVKVVRSNKLNDVGLTISAENGDVVIDGVAGAVQYDVKEKAVVEGVEGITGSITGNNVTLKSSTGSAIDILNNGNLTVAANTVDGSVILTGADFAVKASGDSELILGDEKKANNVIVNGRIEASNNAKISTTANSTLVVDAKYLNPDNDNAFITTDSGNVNVGGNLKVTNAKTGDTLKFTNNDGLNAALTDKVISSNVLQDIVKGDGVTFTVGTVSSAEAEKALAGAVITNVALQATEDNIDAITALFNGADQSQESKVAALNSVANMGELAGVNHGTYSMSNQMTDAVADHLSIATHSEQDNDIWAHYIHNKEDIDGMNLGGVDGNYEAQYNGIVVGSDLYKNGKTTAGIALSYADGNINGSNSVSSTKNEAEYYGASLYGRIDNGNSAILGDISYMHSDNDITQTNMGQEITASADADAFSIGIRAEQAYEAGAGKFVPYAGIRYMHLGAGDYSNSLGMEYNADDQNLWLLPVGVTYSAEVQSGDWTLKPIAEVGYVWTMGDRDTDQTVSLNGAADTFGFETADSGSFIGRLGIEAEKADVTYGLSYEYQKGDTVKANKWMANLTFSF
mgnify:CR=1 FL=1